jgi:NAD(P)-dependent dehydrogenase (short-subunit alcohol dehydrogenase family)
MTTVRDRRVLVFGGTRGLGRALAHRLAADGAAVFVASRSRAAVDAAVEGLAARQPARPPHGLRCDIAKEVDVGAAFDAALDTMDGLDAVVNCAGVLGPTGPTDSVDWAEWRAAVETNLFGSALVARAAITVFRRTGKGKLVFLSGGGATKALPGMSSYCASKAGLVRLVETLAEELRDTQIDVNAVAPGPLATDMLTEVEAAGPDAVGAEYHRQVRTWRRQGATPLDTPVGLIEFLISAESDGVRGRLISALWDPWQDPPALTEALRDKDMFMLRRVDLNPARSS